ncbi:Cytochrome p450 protein [Neofusicoccum parvum]|uniref:Cytochrome p450 protein n=1 Tax=Neofusicoccum parvum TaxID=310453 RepID=A0ACB5SJ39_9PEZI|nr:Cytochrome p450 protein [Neofusicoccum parvum]
MSTVARISTYNVFFSPLRKYPGPKLAAATHAVWWYHTLSGNYAAWSKSLHDQYGCVVRMGPDRLSYIQPEAWKHIYGHRTSTHKANAKSSRQHAPQMSGSHSILSEPDDRRHAEIRKIFSNAFSDRALKLQEDLIMKYVNKLINNIQENIDQDPGAKLDLVKLYNFTTFDIMGELTFGESLGLLDQSEYSPWVSAIFKNVKAVTIRTLQQQYPIVRSLVRIFMPRSMQLARQNHYQYSVDRVDRRLGTETDKADIWNLVLDKNKGVLSLSDMHANASVFMVAGTETTATLLSGLSYHLLMNRDKLQKATDEVRSLSEEQLNLEALPHLEYLSACFEEGLRCYPPVPSGLLREVPQGGNTICGEWLPPKTCICVSHWAAYHSASNFKDPDSFIPERWLPDTGYDDDKKEAMQPFSVGPRNCIGKNLAYHEMRLILAKILWHFDIKICPESENWENQKAWLLWDKPALLVKAKKAQ